MTHFTHSILIESPFNKDEDDDEYECSYVELLVTFTHIKGCKATYYDPGDGPENEIVKIEMFSDDDESRLMLYPVAIYDYLAGACQESIDNLEETFFDYYDDY